jgi:hypothetical protein
MKKIVKYLNKDGRRPSRDSNFANKNVEFYCQVKPDLILKKSSKEVCIKSKQQYLLEDGVKGRVGK